VQSELENSISTANGGAFYVRGGNGNTVTSSDTKVEYCFTSENGGGAWTLIDTDLTDTGSEYNYLGARNGGAFSLENSDVVISQATFVEVNADFGGAFFVTADSSVELVDIAATNVFAASQGGFIYLD